MTRYGEEGVDYVPADPEDESYYEGYDALYVSILPWAIPNNKRWDNGSPYIRNAVISNGIAVKGKLTVWMPGPTRWPPNVCRTWTTTR